VSAYATSPRPDSLVKPAPGHSGSPRCLSDPKPTRLVAAGGLLDAHIRLEERQLFPLIEELVPDDELGRLALADRDATCAVRRPPLTS
jgi:hypothetical protein